jgi:hypothetical protein
MLGAVRGDRSLHDRIRLDERKMAREGLLMMHAFVVQHVGDVHHLARGR